MATGSFAYTDASGNVYIQPKGGGIYILPAGGGAAVLVQPSPSGLIGTLVDANFNLYWGTDGGAVMKANALGGYFVSPELPAGLTIDPTSGAISGTPAPTATTPATNYTVTAFNTAGSGTATLNIAVNLTPPVISFSTPQTYTTGTAITPLTPASTGCAVAAPQFNTTATTLYTSTDILDGLATDKSGNTYIADESSGSVLLLTPGSSTTSVFATGFSTGNVRHGIAVDASGNVFLADGVSVWKISAGGGTAVKLGSFTQPDDVAVDGAGNVYVADYYTGISKMAQDGTGQTSLSSNTAIFVSVDLNGNVFFPSNNNIYEIPAGGAQKALYAAGEIVAFGMDPSGNIYYFSNKKTYTYMLPAGGVSPIQFGPGLSNQPDCLMLDAGFNLYWTTAQPGSLSMINAIGGYFVSPELPQGLTIDPTAGIISGTPTVASAATNYTVSAFNASGSGTVTVNIAVNLGLPAISYSTPQTYTTGAVITPLTAAGTGGAVASPAFNPTPTALCTGITDVIALTMDKAGNIYIGNNSTAGEVLELAPGSSTPTVFASGFATVTGLAVDASGNVYVADKTSTSLSKIPAGGGTAVKLGSFTGPPNGVALDAAGNIYVADNTGGVIKMGPDGSGQTVISTIASNYVSVDLNGNVFFGPPGSVGMVYEIPAGGVQKVYAQGLGAQLFTADVSGNLYIDMKNGSIAIVPAGGGTPLQVGPSGLSNPLALFVDPSFNLYWAEGGTLYKENAVGGYFVSPELPPGLIIDPTAGIISGTPAAASPATTYTVTAFNAAGSGTTALFLLDVTTTGLAAGRTMRLFGFRPARTSSGRSAGLFLILPVVYVVSVDGS